jgi:cyclophilin family peptidyl-prolyl cis-trans isomerase
MLAAVPTTARPAHAVRAALLVGVLALGGGLAACGDDDEPSGSTATTAATTTDATTETATTETAPATTDDAAAADGCRSVEQPEADDAKTSVAEPRPARLSGAWRVTFTTSCGSFVVELDTKRQPKTSASVASLVRKRFYDGLGFVRIVPGFVIQGGDPLQNGTGGPGYSVTEEPPSDAAYTEGVVAMAKAANEAPGTSSSQFFVVTGADSQLPPEYAILGKVVKGLDVVKRIEGVGTSDPSGDGPPAQPVVIDRAVLRRG